ncbi:hypothetical protein Bca4012_095755 [Brassica carinata]
MSLWIRIRNIPPIFYTAETMYKLASEVGKVEEIAYDPKIPQTKEYIRAMITFDVANPVKATRKLNVPSGRTVTIEFEYEKIHKRCFHCLRLTHEKIRCPLLRRGHGNDRRVIHDRVPEHSLERNRTTSMPLKGVCLEGPPGFPMLFPELSPEDRKMAMLYISHSDETERLARIERVKQRIAENASESSLRLTRITKELDKGKGHVFSYTEPPLERSQKNLALTASKDPRRHDLHPDGESGSSGPHFSSQSAPNLAPTVFRLGPSSEGLTTGNVGSKKPQRRRPQAWKRREMPKAGKRETDLSAPSSLPPSSSMKRKLIRQIIVEEDVERVLQIKPNRSRVDSLKWCFSNNGIYNSKSGYKLLQELHELHAPATNSMPPLEKRLWSSLWKAKASPKLRHFLWRVLSRALAVKQQLRYRGIQVDPLCSVCGTEAESICHMLFNGPRAREVWSLSQLPLPVAGFSQNSVFLNLHYLFTCSRNERISPAIRLSFPWILWHIWKARNMLSFEQVCFSAVEIWNKASEEASVWHELHNVEVPAHTTQPIAPGRQQSWVKPPCDLVKCNIGCSWSARTSAVGSSWIIRDTRGNVLCHSRRRFTKIFSEAQAAMETFEWAFEAMLDLKFQRVILEFSNRVLHNIFNQGFPVLEFGAWLQKIHNSFLSFEISKISWVPVGCNSIALEISDSVIRDQRNSEIYGFIPSGRRYHKGSVHQCVELRYEITGYITYYELQSAESLAAEQSRCFKLEVAEVRQKIKTMETLENKLELLHRQRAVASEQAAANMNGKRQSSGSVWGWLAGTLPPKA